MRIYLDDERATPEGWTRCYWPDEVIALLQTDQVTEISLDHDLGDDKRGTGYDVILWIEEAVALHGLKPPRLHVHSANASAREKMLAGIHTITRLADLQAGRQQEIDTLLSHIASYWRLNPRLQFHELAESLIPSGAMVLDGPRRDDPTLLDTLKLRMR
ncbi:MAG: cyclic-phosphate processing receiver domain-containing protein [Rhodoferax sp.]|uniref:cyclic-phosphate processing receiver domain-containing protein n=1 Tax=Rhodoferax sp. TaxID=50421 RepID=UPI002ACE096C|nr:cyclic-phosphate processing receiver domain-containing protein [Rhodoferax sp.]MDZ7890873.1 cyclic-phosphate processing receiver domain-containing protein [Rhodoferax sp.]